MSAIKDGHIDSASSKNVIYIEFIFYF